MTNETELEVELEIAELTETEVEAVFGASHAI
ncbi:hypothetical protein J2X35_001886 [Mesorhizobium sp. BE184]|nr:hypothetical protein [Mesorhizobium sp. BE184]